MTLQDTTAKFTPDLLKQTGDFAKYERLVALEPSTNWLGWCAKIYKKSHSIRSVSKRICGAWVFREFLQDSAQALGLNTQDAENKPLPLISQLFDGVKSKTNSAKYKVFDEFSTWCDGIKGYRPNTTWAYVNSVKQLAKYCDTGVTNDEFKTHVSMPTNTALDEEYPPNDVILRIIDACPPDLRRFVLYLIDTGAEPADAAKLNKDMIYFDEKPVRIQYKRKKTGKPITQFVNDYTANALKQQIEATASDDGLVFVETLKPRAYGKFYTLYAKVLKRANLAEKIDGTNFSKYHFKIFKKRWFTMAISAGMPEYVAQGMLGRKKYLDQYMALPLDQKREFAKKILRKVSIYSTPEDDAEKSRILAETLGLPALTQAQFQAIRGMFMRVLEKPQSQIFDDLSAT